MTPAGRALFARLPPLAGRVNAQAARGLSRDEVERLTELLRALVANFDEAVE